MTCPTCPRSASHVFPCVECWRTMTPADKVGWLFLLRTGKGEGLAALRGFAHRDPVKDAPPGLAAYVVFLEAEIARLDALLIRPEGRC